MGTAAISPALREIKQLLCVQSLILYHIKQIDSMLPCICPVIDHRGRQNVVKTSVTHSANASCATFLSLPHFDVLCDLLLDRCTATWNIFVNHTVQYNIQYNIQYNFVSLCLKLRFRKFVYIALEVLDQISEQSSWHFFHYCLDHFQWPLDFPFQREALISAIGLEEHALGQDILARYFNSSTNLEQAKLWFRLIQQKL